MLGLFIAIVLLMGIQWKTTVNVFKDLVGLFIELCIETVLFVSGNWKLEIDSRCNSLDYNVDIFYLQFELRG